MLFKLRHKAPRVGIVEDLLELDDKATLDDAERLGREICNQEPGWLYIAVDYAILNKRPKAVDADDTPVLVRKAG